MDTVNIKRTQLLDTVMANRKAHVEEHAEAAANYRKTVQAELAKRLADVEAGKDINLNFHGLPAPVSQVKEYDRAIRMLEMSTDDIILLQQHDFNQLVMDEWQWSGGFKAITSVYNNSVR
jgi:hypothetical protein